MSSISMAVLAIEEGKLWSFLRRTLERGGDQWHDYHNGTHGSYEEFSAYRDATARELVEELIRLGRPVTETERELTERAG